MRKGEERRGRKERGKERGREGGRKEVFKLLELQLYPAYGEYSSYL